MKNLENIMNTSPFNLNGKVAIVTGAGTGIGQALALGLAAAGANIAAIYRSHYDETKSQLSEYPVKSNFYKLDLETASVEEIYKVVAEVVKDFGRLDILVNNAGTIAIAKAVEYPLEYWESVLRVNLINTFYLCQASAKYFMENKIKGKIINIASMLSFQGGDLVVAYTASKSGLAGITKTMTNEWAKYGININAIAPGYITTENTRPLWENPKENDRIINRIPAGRWGQPSDLAGTTVFLASEASDYINGTIIPVDGGWLAR
jgi:2-dehydro-3-deoxy-D-gluconate 5-dehydrogenase